MLSLTPRKPKKRHFTVSNSLVFFFQGLMMIEKKNLCFSKFSVKNRTSKKFLEDFSEQKNLISPLQVNQSQIFL